MNTVLSPAEVKAPVKLTLEGGSRANTNVVHGHARRSGLSREYMAWENAKKRCFKANNAKFPGYGGRGITMCPEWTGSFLRFISDMGPCPAGFTLERKDVNGNYEPGNCIWISKAAQALNRRDNHRVEYNGKNQTIAEWSRETGIGKDTIAYRLRHYPLEKVFSPDDFRADRQFVTHRSIIVEFNGQKMSLTRWSEALGIRYTTMRSRMNREKTTDPLRLFRKTV